MAETMKDLNVQINLGGVFSHWNGVQGGGGELVPYDATSIGGPPETNFDSDVRAALTYTITTRVIGDTDQEREDFVAKFRRGTVFSCKSNPSGSGDMYISGDPDAIGKDFVVMNASPNHQFQQNTELTITLQEKGPTGGGGSGSGSG